MLTNDSEESIQSKARAAQIPWKALRGILFDWAGTTIDFGCMAPVEVVRRVFSENGVEVTEAEARLPMGKAKIDHLREVISMPRVSKMWQERNAQAPSELAVQMLYEQFIQLQKIVLGKYADLIPGVLEFVADLRQAGIKVGSTTGYTRELMEVILPIAEQSGYRPDATVCSDEVKAGRPAPWSNFRAAELIGIYPMNRLVVVDDSVAGIQAGKLAGCYAVAVTLTGNALGKSQADLASILPTELSAARKRAEIEFYNAGADLVVDSVSSLHKVWKADVA